MSSIGNNDTGIKRHDIVRLTGAEGGPGPLSCYVVSKLNRCRMVAASNDVVSSQS